MIYSRFGGIFGCGGSVWTQISKAAVKKCVRPYAVSPQTINNDDD